MASKKANEKKILLKFCQKMVQWKFGLHQNLVAHSWIFLLPFSWVTKFWWRYNIHGIILLSEFPLCLFYEPPRMSYTSLQYFHIFIIKICELHETTAWIMCTTGHGKLPSHTILHNIVLSLKWTDWSHSCCPQMSQTLVTKESHVLLPVHPEQSYGAPGHEVTLLADESPKCLSKDLELLLYESA